MGFNSIIGHEDVKKQIEHSIESGKFAHAHLIVGENGIGKSFLAAEIAKKLLGKNVDKDYVDIIEWSVPKNKKSIGVNEVREIIKEVNKKPYESDKKVIIIYESDKMTIEAQNAFLKTIEEPPSGVTLILLSESLELILDTIKSRSQIYKLNRLSPSEIDKYISIHYSNIKQEEKKAIIAFSDGIPGRCDDFINNVSYRELRNITLKILLELMKRNKFQLKQYEKFFYENNYIWQEILNCFISYIRDIMIYKETKNKNYLINNDKIDGIKELSSVYSFNQLDQMIDILNDSRKKLDAKVNAAMVFNVMLLNMQEV